jgi:hypothetical protein
MEQSLAGILAFTGLMGSCATGLAWLCHVDPFGSFHWDLQDMLTGLKFMLPVYLMNIAILLPSYSSWKLPDAETFLARKQAMLAATAPQPNVENPEAAASAGQAAAVEHTDAESSGSNRKNDMVGEPNITTSSSRPGLGGAMLPAAAAGPTGRSVLPAGTEPATRTFLQGLRDALHLSQGHYLNLNPQAQLPPALELGTLTVECMAAEMLYRAVALQATGGWLLDRWYEAGGDELLLGASLAAGGGAAGVSDVVEGVNAGALQTAEGAALLLLAAASLVMVGQRMVRTATRPARLRMMMEAQQLQWQKQQERQGQQQQKVLRLHVPPRGVETSQAQQQQQQQQQQGVTQRGIPDKVQQQKEPQQWWRLLPTTMNALVWSQGVQGVRDVGQFVGLGLAYVLTGNLAASYAAAVVNQVLMSWLQRRGMVRTKQVRGGALGGKDGTLGVGLCGCSHGSTSAYGAAAEGSASDLLCRTPCLLEQRVQDYVDKSRA